ncbi:MAG: fimbrillin family protein [Bacteroidales bacterium]
MKHFLATSLSIVLLTACDKGVQNDENNTVRFTAQLNAITKSAIPFPVGNKATIHVYNAADLSTPLAGTPSLATAQNNGGVSSLTIDALSFPFSLNKGNYDFYCVTTNTAIDPGITFTNGKSDTLSNNVDYLYASNKGVVVSSNTNVPFTFYHKNVKISIKITPNAAQGVTAVTIKNIGLKLPVATGDQQGKMDLATGVITPATTFAQTYTDITKVDDVNCSYIILPVAITSGTAQTLSYTVKMDMTVQGTRYIDRIYNFSIALPAAGLDSGKNYTYTGLAGSKEVTFSPVIVEDWIISDQGSSNGEEI